MIISSIIFTLVGFITVASFMLIVDLLDAHDTAAYDEQTRLND